MDLDKDEAKAALGPQYRDIEERYDGAVRAMQSRWNMTIMSPQISVGGAIVSKHMAGEIEEIAGMSHVICVAREECEHDEKYVGEKTDMRLFCALIAPLSDEPCDPRDVLAIWDWVQCEMRRSVMHECPYPRFYIHCHDGKHRSIGIAAFLLAMLCGKDVEHWIKKLSARHAPSEVHRYPEFKQMLCELYCQLAPHSEDEEDEGEGEEYGEYGGEPAAEQAQDGTQSSNELGQPQPVQAMPDYGLGVTYQSYRR